jgi:hypothetical protein
MRPSRTSFWGFAAVIFFIAHGTVWIGRGVPGGLLWACHLGCLMVGIAVLARRPFLNAVGVLWLALGNALWVIDLAWGGEFIATSPLTHLGGILIGLWYARREGFPRGAWLTALAGIACLHVLSGFVTPPRENINIAFSVHGSLRPVFPSFQMFRLFMLAATAAFFCAGEWAIRAILAKNISNKSSKPSAVKP